MVEKFQVIKRKIQNIELKEDSFRLFHGRGGVYSGLEHICIDYFSPDILITLYKEEIEVENLAEFIWKNFKELRSVVIQKRYSDDETVVKFGNYDRDTSFAKWRGLRFKIDLLSKQNVGFFLDMENGREFISKNSKGRKVLNMFSYTCALSVIACHEGAKRVVNIDMSKSALKKGKENHVINGIDPRSASFFGHDILKSMGKLKKLGPYDLIIIDPPSSQGKSFNLLRDYKKILVKVSSMMSKDSVALICANSPFVTLKEFENLVSEYAPELSIKDSLFSCETFEESNKEKGLKILICEQ